LAHGNWGPTGARCPGARSTEQARQNAAAASLPPLPQAELGAIEGLYDKYFRAKIHGRW
jgi:hypothetical protein